MISSIYGYNEAVILTTIYTFQNSRGVVLECDQVAKLKIAKIFPGVFAGDSRKFMIAKISRYTVILL